MARSTRKEDAAKKGPKTPPSVDTSTWPTLTTPPDSEDDMESDPETTKPAAANITTPPAKKTPPTKKTPPSVLKRRGTLSAEKP
jgi:hypothetical protein